LFFLAIGILCGTDNVVLFANKSFFTFLSVVGVCATVHPPDIAGRVFFPLTVNAFDDPDVRDEVGTLILNFAARILSVLLFTRFSGCGVSPDQYTTDNKNG
jgi:hypothetical protein